MNCVTELVPTGDKGLAFVPPCHQSMATGCRWLGRESNLLGEGDPAKSKSPGKGTVLLLLLFFLATPCGISVPRPGIELGPTAVKAGSPNHWTAREFPGTVLSLAVNYHRNWGLGPLAW